MSTEYTSSEFKKREDFLVIGVGIISALCSAFLEKQKQCENAGLPATLSEFSTVLLMADIVAYLELMAKEIPVIAPRLGFGVEE